MVDLINKLVYVVLNPFGVAMLGLLGAVGLKVLALFFVRNVKRRKRIFRLSWFLVCVSFMWAWVWSTKVVYKELGGWLERPYVKYADKESFAQSGEWTWGPVVEDYPNADAIVVLGGGMGCHTNGCPYANMSSPADRVWHAVRLYRAGKAPVIIASGCAEQWATKPLLRDFGIPEEAVIFETDSVNTEENAKFTDRLVHGLRASKMVGDQISKPRILLVTSAWHMRRSEFLFRKYAPGLEIIPSPTDFEATMTIMHPDGFRLNHILPDPAMLATNSAMLKEILGLVGYTIFR